MGGYEGDGWLMKELGGLEGDGWQTANEGAGWLRGRWAAKLVVHLYAFSILDNLKEQEN
jgi:hypothetical protein